jgi:hypothetical protein
MVLGISGDLLDKSLTEFLEKGLGNQVGLHVYDAPPTFVVQLGHLIGESLGLRPQGLLDRNGELRLFRFLATGLKQPVYVALPIQDAKVVDQFLKDLDGQLTAMAERPPRGRLGLRREFSRHPLKETVVRSFSLRLGPIQFQLHWARIGDGLYLASQPVIFADLLAAEAERAKGGATGERGSAVHAVFRLHLNKAQEAVADLRRDWAEQSQTSCRHNLVSLANVARAFPPPGPGTAAATARWAAALTAHAERLYGTHFFCPEGGRYVPASDGKRLACTIHGDGSEISAQGTLDEMLRRFPSLIATLTLGDEGARVVVTIERREGAK